MSWQLVFTDIWLRLLEKPRLSREQDPARARARAETVARLFPLPRAMTLSEAPLPGGDGPIPALRLTGQASSGRLLWLHGGAYCLGSPRTHASLAAALSVRATVDAVLPSYRLAPENPFPAAVEDALAAYLAVLAEGTPPSKLILGGDSAGGGLVLAVLHLILEQGLPVPAGVVAFSPWTDLTLTGSSLRGLATEDAFLPAERVPAIRDLYLAGADPLDPRASPWLGQFTGAPPVLIQASRSEILLDDAARMADTLRRDGVAVELDLWARTPHAWQLLHAGLPEAGVAIERAAAFMRRALGTPP